MNKSGVEGKIKQIMYEHDNGGVTAETTIVKIESLVSQAVAQARKEVIAKIKQHMARRNKELKKAYDESKHNNIARAATASGRILQNLEISELINPLSVPTTVQDTECKCDCCCSTPEEGHDYKTCGHTRFECIHCSKQGEDTKK